MYLHSYPSTHSISRLAADGAWEQFVVHLQMVIKGIPRRTWKPWRSEFGDTIAGQDPANLEAVIEYLGTHTSWPWWCKLGDHYWTTLVMLVGGRDNVNLEAEIEWVLRCTWVAMIVWTWRLWLGEFGDALGGHDHANLQAVLKQCCRQRCSESRAALWFREWVSLWMQLKAVIKWERRSSWRQSIDSGLQSVVVFISELTLNCGNVTRWLHLPTLMESWLMTVNHVGRHTRSWRYILGSTCIHQNEGRTNNLQWRPYSVYAVLGVNSWQWHGEIERDDSNMCSAMMVELCTWKRQMGMKIQTMWSKSAQMRNHGYNLPDWVRKKSNWCCYMRDWHWYLLCRRWYLDSRTKFTMSQFLMIFSPISSHLSLSCPQLYYSLRTWSQIIPLNLSMSWSWVNTAYGIHRVQCDPTIDYLLLPANLSSLISRQRLFYSVLCISSIMSQPRNWVSAVNNDSLAIYPQQIDCPWIDRLQINRLQINRLQINCLQINRLQINLLQVHLWTRAIPPCTCISTVSQSRPPSTSLSCHGHSAVWRQSPDRIRNECLRTRSSHWCTSVGRGRVDRMGYPAMSDHTYCRHLWRLSKSVWGITQIAWIYIRLASSLYLWYPRISGCPRLADPCQIESWWWWEIDFLATQALKWIRTFSQAASPGASPTKLEYRLQAGWLYVYINRLLEKYYMPY